MWKSLLNIKWYEWFLAVPIYTFIDFVTDGATFVKEHLLGSVIVALLVWYFAH